MSASVIFVASTGGHLEQLYRMHRSLLGRGQRAVWVTFDNSQSRSLLSAEPDVIFVQRVGSRGYLDLLRNLVPASRLLGRIRPDVVISTGAGIALAFLPFAWLVRASATYIESAARTDGPSLTGRLLRLLPWIHLRTQYRAWSGKRWQYAGSVFDEYLPVVAEQSPPTVHRVLVTLGTQEGYPFVSLVQRLTEIVPNDIEMMWQVGPDFPQKEKPLAARDFLDRAELLDEVRRADAIVSHAGVGSALTLLDLGRLPVLVARSATRGEHVDEHQRLIAEELSSRGLAISVEPGQLQWEDIVRSTTIRVARRSHGAGQ